MKQRLIISLLILSTFGFSALAHDLFLKLDTYFVEPGSKVSIKVLNGSFIASEGPVAFERLADVSTILPDGKRTKAAETDFTKDEKTAYINFQPRESGTYVVGLSTLPREIKLSGKDFNAYLEEDGIPDTLAERKKNSELEKGVRERYSKHVKTAFQVGEALTGNHKQVFGYPVEIVPRNNPYSLKVGDTLVFICLKDGKPIPNQYVMTGYDDGTNHRPSENIRSDKKGVVRLKISVAGKWYVKFIHMTRLNEPKLDYESKWASFSFEVR